MRKKFTLQGSDSLKKKDNLKISLIKVLPAQYMRCPISHVMLQSVYLVRFTRYHHLFTEQKLMLPTLFFSELGGSNFRGGLEDWSPPVGFKGRIPDGGLGDINPRAGFRGRAPGEGLGTKLPEAEETVQIVHFNKYFVSGEMSKWAYRYCSSTQICIQKK